MEKTTQDEQIDYTAERDDRVIPFVTKLIKGLGDFPFAFNRTNTTEDAKAETDSFAEYIRNGFMIDAMQSKIKHADLSYTFQLAGIVIEMLKSRATTAENENSEHLTDCAQNILACLGAEQSLALNFRDDTAAPEVSSEERAKLYDRFYNEIVVPSLEAHQVKPNEINRVFEIMTSLMANVGRMVGNTVNDAREVAEQKMWGVENINDLDILTIHRRVIAESEKEAVH